MNMDPPVEIELHGPPEASVIWLHGLGADGHDFEAVVPELNIPANLPIRFIFPHAPARLVTINDGMAMRAWYDIAGIGPGFKEDEQGLAESREYVESLIEQEINRGIDSHRIILAGFSQGGSVALHTGLRCSRKLGGIMALSSYLSLADSLHSELNPANRSVPVLMLHGDIDPIVPISIAQGSCRQLMDEGVPVEWKVYSTGHTLCLEEVTDIRQWLISRLQ